MGIYSRICSIRCKQRNTDLYKGLSDKSALFNSEKTVNRRPNRPGSDKLKPSLERSMFDCLEPSWVSDIFVTRIWCQRDRNWSPERHLVIPSATLPLVDIFLSPIFPEITQSRTKWYRTSICLEALWWTKFFNRATTPLMWMEVVSAEITISILLFRTHSMQYLDQKHQRDR